MPLVVRHLDLPPSGVADWQAILGPENFAFKGSGARQAVSVIYSVAIETPDTVSS